MAGWLINLPPVPHRIESVEPVSLAIGKCMLNDRAMFEWLADPNAWVSLLTLTILEIVLGVDNIIFISILAGKLPPEQQGKARTVGLMLALITRLLLRCSIFGLSILTTPLFIPFGHGVWGRDLLLLVGGLLLMWKAVDENHGRLEGEVRAKAGGRSTMSAVIFEIVIVDVVSSLASVITAIGLAQRIGVMVTAVILAVVVML